MNMIGPREACRERDGTRYCCRAILLDPWMVDDHQETSSPLVEDDMICLADRMETVLSRSCTTYNYLYLKSLTTSGMFLTPCVMQARTTFEQVTKRPYR